MNPVMYNYGYCAHRDGLHTEYDKATRAAGKGDTGAKEWLAGWYAYNASI